MAAITAMKHFFGSEGYPELKTREISALKKADPEGFKRIAEGIENGTLDYEPAP